MPVNAGPAWLTELGIIGPKEGEVRIIEVDAAEYTALLNGITAVCEHLPTLQAALKLVPANVRRDIEKQLQVDLVACDAACRRATTEIAKVMRPPTDTVQ